MKKILLFNVIAILSISGIFSQDFLPTPPAGFEWVLNEAISDEFENQNTLDTEKWHPRLPFWRGRVPAEFLPENVFVGTVNDNGVDKGMMYIRNTVHPNPNDGYTIAGGGIESRQTQKYGYFEARMKASDIRMGSAFWLNTNRNWDNPRVDSPNRGDGCFGYAAEIDIQECLGGGNDFWAKRVHVNTHFKRKRFRDGTQNCYQEFLSEGDFSKVLPDNEKVSDDFHIYSAWWVDANTVRFYFDGELVKEIKRNDGPVKGDKEEA